MHQTDFWTASGYRLLATTDQRRLLVTDAFLSFLLDRPELAPVETSCDAERALFATLVASPRQAIEPRQLDALANPDVADNYRMWLRFRDRLVARPTLEASYLAWLQDGVTDVPPVLVNQITHVLVRHVVGDEAQAMEARVAELFFRTQLITVTDEAAVLAADHETIQSRAENSGFDLMRLLRQGSSAVQGDELNVLNPDNQDIYWPRNQHHDTVIYLNRQNPAIKTLCALIAKWISHFLGVTVRVTALEKIHDKKWVWHLGLDAQATQILNDLYLGNRVDNNRLKRILCLFKLEFEDATAVVQKVRGRPIYMAMAQDEQNLLRIKPQNLLLNLPLAG